MDIKFKKNLNSFGFSLKKAYGQNFISDKTILNKIVEAANLCKDDTVLEIGCGAGTLTSVLAKNCKYVVGYEIDKTLQNVLNYNLQYDKNVSVIFKDIMKEKICDIESKVEDNYILVANLPYYITTPIVMRFLENSKKIKAMVIMVQEEVANRFSAKEGTSDYGAITVAINLRGSAKKIIRVGKENFTPVPKVDSAVVKIDIDRTKNKFVNFDEVREVVKASFMGRRKMLVNNLINYYKISKELAKKIILESDINETARGEELSYEKFIMLSESIKKYIKQ